MEVQSLPVVLTDCCEGRDSVMLEGPGFHSPSSDTTQLGVDASLHVESPPGPQFFSVEFGWNGELSSKIFCLVRLTLSFSFV